jgi:hypothetical protein
MPTRPFQGVVSISDSHCSCVTSNFPSQKHFVNSRIPGMIGDGVNYTEIEVVVAATRGPVAEITYWRARTANPTRRVIL